MTDANSQIPKELAAPLVHRPSRSSSPCDDCGARARSFCDVLEGREFPRLAAIVTGRSYDAGQVIIQEGDQAEWLFNVTSGTVKIYRTLPDGRAQIVGFLSEGDFMGMPATRYGFSAEAVGPVELCVFPRRSFDQLMQDFPTLERRLFELANNEVAAARDHMLLLGRKTARERVASFLVAMATKPNCVHVATPCVNVPMGRREIADYLGLTMETVSRTLTALRKEGLIARRSSDQLLLTQLSRLREIAAVDS